jgi:hypothetical protein
VEYVAVLDRGLALVTVEGGAQMVIHTGRWETLPLPPAPEDFVEQLATRWDRAGGYYDETDPLPRDLQYRRSFDASQGVGRYFNYVTPDLRHLLILFSLGPESRILRIVNLPDAWHRPYGS